MADATVVLFDPELDLALLYAPDVDGPGPGASRTDRPERGDPRARRSATRAAGRSSCCRPRSSGSYPATGRDIYGTDRVTRDILELRAQVEPGDSGGPLVLEDGTVGGLVFAESRTDPEVGYALTPESVARADRARRSGRRAPSTSGPASAEP